MSYTQRIINDRPIHFFPLVEGANAFKDATVNDLATVIGTPVVSPPLVVGGDNAYVFDGNNNFRFPADAFQETSVLTPFTLEAWFKPVDVNGPKGIIGHGGQEDGLTFDGEKISFSTLHVNAGKAEASYYPVSISGAMHVVGVHTGSKNELYLNGVRVASTELTTEQLSAPYQVSIMPDNLYVGHLSGSIIIDAVAVYPVALTSRQAKLHFLWGRDVLDYRDVVSRREGTYWEFSDETARVLFEYKFDNSEEWGTGESTSTTIVDNVLRPSFDESGLTRDSNWRAGVILSAIADSMDGSKISWDSDGSVKVHTSLNNGNTWSEAVNGREVPGIGTGFNSAEQSLLVRVSFSSGEPLDTISRMRSLSVKFYESRESIASRGEQAATFSGNYALADRVMQPIEHDDQMGVNLYGANVNVPLVDTRTVEMWIRPTESPGVDEYIFDARPGVNSYLRFSGSQWSTTTSTQVYINGERKTGAAINIVPFRWNHIVVVLPSPANSIVSVGHRSLSMNLGMVSAYPATMNAADVKSLYNAHIGNTSIPISETSGLIFRDSAEDNIKIYAYSWSLRSSG